MEYFDTKHAAPPVVFDEGLAPYESWFRSALSWLPESSLVSGALMTGPQLLGLDAKQSESLLPLLQHSYTDIMKDPLYQGFPSSLPYAFSPEQPAQGQYQIYTPHPLPKDAELLVFLHGYGGNFQFYSWVLKEAFPDAVIVLPSYGISWSPGSSLYLEEVLADVERKLKRKFPEPWLIGLSAGGRGGFRMIADLPERFQGFICLANAPESQVIPQLKGKTPVLMILGKEDRMVPLAIARQQALRLRQQLPQLVYREIPGDHFFLLSEPEATFREVQRFMNWVKEQP